MDDNPDVSKLVKIREMIAAAESSLKAAKDMLEQVTGLPNLSSVDVAQYADKAATLHGDMEGEGRIIEGVFDGQNMVDKKGSTYPVPANYASKSKLIPGDILKLTVTEEGKFLYKQIGPVERVTVVGPLVYNDGRYQVLANNKAYNVLLASVTYFRAQVGDEVTLIIPKDQETDWGAIEAVLPKFEGGEAEEPKKKTTTKKAKKDDDLDIEEELDI